MRVLIACEFSGQTRSLFRLLGHEAYSCDLLPAEDNSPFHFQQDVTTLLSQPWDLLIAHPPCTHLAVSGARHFKSKPPHLQQEALEFVRLLMNAPIPRIAIENPVSVISTHIRKPDQIIHPYHFGHPETKATCLWLKGLPPLKHTKVVRPVKGSQIHSKLGHWKDRSRTYLGVSAAMATQWGGKS